MHLRLLAIAIILAILFEPSEAFAKRRRRKRFTGPPPTHPVVLWSRTLEESKDKEQRKVAAFKLSQYSQTIYQDSIVNNLIRCSKDPDVEIRVLCTKALGNVDTRGHQEVVRKALLDIYKQDSTIKNTVVRTLFTRRDSNPQVQEMLLASATSSQDPDELVVLLDYFSVFGSGSDSFVDVIIGVYNRSDNAKVKRTAVKVLGDRAKGQKQVLELLSACTDGKDTPLALNCLTALQEQPSKDSTVWVAVEKTILSDDNDVLVATLDLINTLPETSNPRITTRLLEIIGTNQDDETREKAVLALGICGDHSKELITTLSKLLEDNETDESVRIASALVMGKQAGNNGAEARTALSKCVASPSSAQSRTACQLGLGDLASRPSPLASTPTPLQPPAPAATGQPASAPPTATNAPEEARNTDNKPNLR